MAYDSLPVQGWTRIRPGAGRFLWSGPRPPRVVPYHRVCLAGASESECRFESAGRAQALRMERGSVCSIGQGCVISAGNRRRQSELYQV